MKKLWISAASNITDAALNAGMSLLNALADLILLMYLWPFSARMANVAEFIGSFATACCYLALGAPVMFEGQVMLPSWCGDITILSISLVGVSLQAIRVMSGPISLVGLKSVKFIFKGIQSFLAATCGGAADKAQDAVQNVQEAAQKATQSLNMGKASELARQSSMVANEGLTGAAEDMFDDTYLPADDDDQVFGIFVVDLSRKNGTSIELMTVVWSFCDSRSACSVLCSDLVSTSAGRTWHSRCWRCCGTGCSSDRGKERRRRACMGKLRESRDQKF